MAGFRCRDKPALYFGIGDKKNTNALFFSLFSGVIQTDPLGDFFHFLFNYHKAVSCRGVSCCWGKPDILSGALISLE
ncbi:MAG TPA: hypothetical protein DEQ41_05220 [Shewanella sp.]|jgi:hypothetical protein|nr:hypothetical protein [Shewanella sp.]